MRREEKTEIINSLAEQLGVYTHFYLADTSGLNAAQTAALRKKCYEQEIKLIVVKNTLLGKALEATGRADQEIVASLTGSTSVMFTNVGNAPARLIKEFRKSAKVEKPALKAAYVDECVYIGESSLEDLINVKSRDELLGDVIAMLQAPAKNVISALQNAAGGTIAGLVKTLEERGN